MLPAVLQKQIITLYSQPLIIKIRKVVTIKIVEISKGKKQK